MPKLPVLTSVSDDDCLQKKTIFKGELMLYCVYVVKLNKKGEMVDVKEHFIIVAGSLQEALAAGIVKHAVAIKAKTVKVIVSGPLPYHLCS